MEQVFSPDISFEEVLAIRVELSVFSVVIQDIGEVPREGFSYH